jgi:hypothetical protein
MNAVLGNIRQNGELNEDDISELKNILSNDTFLEGFFCLNCAFKELKKWRAGDKCSNEELINLLLALHKYYSRMCSRCTPFGTFAGISTIR